MLQQSYNLREIDLTMKARIISIGNSKGIIIPSALMKQLSLEEDVEMEVENGALVVRPTKASRAGWEEQIQRAMQKGKSEKALPDFFNDENLEEWTW